MEKTYILATYRDTETGDIINTPYLMAEFAELKKEGGTDARTFGEYLQNCLDKDGTLELI